MNRRHQSFINPKIAQNATEYCLSVIKCNVSLDYERTQVSVSDRQRAAIFLPLMVGHDASAH